MNMVFLCAGNSCRPVLSEGSFKHHGLRQCGRRNPFKAELGRIRTLMP